MTAHGQVGCPFIDPANGCYTRAPFIIRPVFPGLRFIMRKPLSAVMTLCRYSLPAILITALLPGCTTLPAGQNNTSQEPPPSHEEQLQASAGVQALFDQYYQSELDQSPVLRSQLGYSGQFEWDDISPEAREQRISFYQTLRNQLHAIREEALPPSLRTSYRTLLESIEYELLMVPFDHYDYGYTQLGGWHTEVVNVLINHHPVTSIPEAHDYISRLEAIPTLFKRWEENIRAAEEDGIIPPAFVYDSVEASIQAITRGAPFDNSDTPSPLWDDFMAKLEQLGLYPSTYQLLERQARSAMLQSVKPAYDQLLALVREQHSRAPQQVAALDHPDGLRYYQLLLSHYSGSQYDADYIHQLGLTEVSRIQQQIRTLAPQLGYDGVADAPISDIFRWVEEHSVRFPDNEQGRDEFIGYQKTRLRQIAERLPYYFTRLPQTPIAVRTVEDYRAGNAPIAFYEAPSLDGTRPGIYYINPQRMNDIPRYRLAALAYHEALPGHHLQIALAQENESLPEFRRIMPDSAFSEGWALYAEKLAGEMGGYQNAEEEYGQLVMELWRAVRLVLDTGLNAKGWSRDQAVQYRLDNTPFSRADSEAAVSRYLVMPGQAVAYKMGELRIQSIRRKVRDMLGSRFDPAAFHSALLSQGALPLDTLQEWMLAWARDQRRQTLTPATGTEPAAERDQ